MLAETQHNTPVLSLSEELLSLCVSGKVEGKLIRYEIRKTACVLNTKTLFGMN
jgi:hypothetical protein